LLLGSSVKALQNKFRLDTNVEITDVFNMAELAIGR